MSLNKEPSHSIVVGYLLWILGFLGIHRFYYGKQITGTIYFFTLGLLFIGWIVDLFLIPGLNAEADLRFHQGKIDFNVSWLILAFLGFFGIHRMYMGKWITGLIFLCTGGLFGLGYIYDLWTLNDQISLINSTAEAEDA